MCIDLVFQGAIVAMCWGSDVCGGKKIKTFLKDIQKGKCLQCGEDNIMSRTGLLLGHWIIRYY